MIERITTLVPWRMSDPERAEYALQQMQADKLIESFAELVSSYREILPHLRPKAPLSSDRQARIDGLLIAILLLDGWLDAADDYRFGRHPRLPFQELMELHVTEAHFQQQTVDFAWRRLTERYGRRIRDLLQGAAILGKPWIGGLRYRYGIARIEQILRAIQVDPQLAYRGGPKPSAMAQGRITWRTLTGRR